MSAPGRLAGRVAIVTGGGDGIGAGIARAYAAEGARVVVAEYAEGPGRAVAEEVGGLFVHTDVSDKAQVHAMVSAAVDTYGSVDVLVNNAWGHIPYSRVEDKTDATIDRAFAVGFRGPLWAMQAAFGHMKQAGWGRVVNLCSLNGVNAHVGSMEYNTAKEALRTLTRTAAREWAPTGVVVNALCPGAKSAAFRRAMSDHPELESAADQGNPMGRIGDPLTDIAPVAVFLASEDCRYLTGNTLFVDGGAHINGVAWQPQLP
ncbi:glucose 1-dehydrogenase [Nocardioides sp. SOB77]|uniref:Glucose 1-dehydrogenase n=1 Tax=Nocardioides oceani TaxID=3058369 RepID=A0ABT8FCQ6_9ACTN|nr:glucose 1-dehydrogenase [Nocardioides oceani]MDN4172187.1 glucose 1-dehydrogenase [Nocardioides oceani]